MHKAFYALMLISVLFVAACSSQQQVAETPAGDADVDETVVRIDEAPDIEASAEETEVVEDEEPEEVPVQTVTHTVEITNSDYNPETLTIKKGDTVIWLNTGSRRNWPASNVHPSHTLYPDSSIQKCGSGEDIFDACVGLTTGESFSFTFNEEGVWRYHNHLSPGMGGTVIVE